MPSIYPTGKPFNRYVVQCSTGYLVTFQTYVSDVKYARVFTYKHAQAYVRKHWPYLNNPVVLPVTGAPGNVHFWAT
jgi:hypothetical protein